MADMSRGVGLAKDVFEKHNIRVTETDGSLRSVIDVMNDVADVTAGMTNATEKADLAYKLFGARGAKMINMLNGGSEAMQKAMAEAKELGLVMSGDTAKGVEDANDAITRLSSFLLSSFTRAVAELAPAIEAITVSIMEWVNLKVREGGGIGAIARSMANAIIMATVDILSALETTANGVIKFANKIQVALGYGSEIDELKSDLEGLRKVQEDFFSDGFGAEGDGIFDFFTNLNTGYKKLVGKFFDPITDATGMFEKQMFDQIVSVKKQIKELENSGAKSVALMDMSVMKEALLATLVPIVALEEGVQKVTAATKELAVETVIAADPTVWDQMKNGFESYFTSVKKGTLSIASITEGIMRTAEDAIVNMLMGVKTNWKSLFKAILADIIRLQVRKAAVSILGGIFGFANGGRPPSNRPSIVGEKGAELFVPDSAGTIVPNDQLGGGGTTAEINFNVQAIDASSFNSFLVTNRDTIESIINNSITTNGSVRRTIQMAG